MTHAEPQYPQRVAYIGLGSNLGDRLAYLQLGVDALGDIPGARVAAVSRVYETSPVGGPPQGAYLNAVVAIETNLLEEELLHRCQQIEEFAARVRAERWGPRTLDVDILLVGDVRFESDFLTIPHPRMWERGFVLAPLRDVAPELVASDLVWEGVSDAGVALVLPPVASRTGSRSFDGANVPATEPAGTRTLALVGPGRAGTALALGLIERGFEVIAVAGRAPDAASTAAAVACLASRPALVSEAGRGADVVIVATPDRAIESAVRSIAPSLEAGALVIHLAGSRGLDAFADLQIERPDVRIGTLHPLQSLPTAAIGLERLHGSWAAVAGDPETAEIARLLGLQPFELPDDRRTTYHAAAVVASNHLVALLGQVERLASAAGVPFEAFAPLVQSSIVNAFGIGPALALTGPVSRGDLVTVEQHLATLDPGERDTYRSLAREVARLTGRRDRGLDRLLDDVRLAAGTEEPGDVDQ